MIEKDKQLLQKLVDSYSVKEIVVQLSLICRQKSHEETGLTSRLNSVAESELFHCSRTLNV